MTLRITNGFLIVFALWTVLANATVLFGGNLRQLSLAGAGSAGVALLAAGTVVALRRQRGRAADEPALLPVQGDSDEPPPVVARIAVAVAAAAVVVAAAVLEEVAIYCAGALLLCAALAVREGVRGLARVQPPVESRTLDGALFLLGLACAAFALTVHRPDADDAFYLNLAVSAVDDPSLRLIHWDTIHGVAGVPIPLLVYKVHSLELLEAVVAWATGLPVLSVAHVMVPAVAAVGVPLAFARLARLLVPGRWIWAVAGAILFFVCIGAPHQGYGNFGLVRLHQGKAIMLSVVLPLVAATALEFGLAPSRARWLRLAAAQIAALGLSASSLWAAPLVAGLCLASTVSFRAGAVARSLGTVAAGLAASSYLVVVAVVLAVPTIAAFAVALPSEWEINSDPAFVLGNVLGDGALGWISLWIAAAGWSLATSSLLRRFAVVLPLGFLLLWNPLTSDWVASYITGVPTYWRIFWLLPLPFLVGAALTAPLELAHHPALRFGIPAVAAVLMFAWAPPIPSWSSQNFVHVGAPQWKLPPAVRGATLEIARRAPSGAYVLAPPAVARWIPTLHEHPTPLVVRHLYLTRLRGHLSPEEYQRRSDLAYLVSAQQRLPGGGELLARAIEEYPLQVVCVSTATAA
ncbi:MAG: DUF6077 domain-containing protein, partial [Proteobacteria bacterium]|nr:DUF6077 domain-containing protein [Pseudomonadota bacterium]